MNDDLTILVFALHIDELLEIAINIEHGLNEFDGWQFYKEPEIKQTYIDIIQRKTGAIITDILKVKQIDYVVKVDS